MSAQAVFGAKASTFRCEHSTASIANKHVPPVMSARKTKTLERKCELQTKSQNKLWPAAVLAARQPGYGTAVEQSDRRCPLEGARSVLQATHHVARRQL